MSRTRASVAIAIAAAVGLTACTGPAGQHDSTTATVPSSSEIGPTHESPSTALSSTKAPGAGASVEVQISVSHCGLGWSGGLPGRQQFRLHNTDTRPGEAYLADAKSGAVFAVAEPLGPGTTTAITVDLPPGSYSFRCAMEDADVIVGPATTVAGTGSTVASTGSTGAYSPSVQPVSQQDMIGPTKAYEHYVTGKLPELLRLVRVLNTDIGTGDLVAARRDWLAAHLLYETLGAAYGAFGDADAEINGLPDGLPAGLADPDFTGFHRLEQGLWHGEAAGTLKPIAAKLVTAVTALGGSFPTSQIDPLEVSIRAHEITENALQFELTGRTDFGSHTNLGTVAANLAGTTTVLDLLIPLLRTRYPALPRLTAALQRATTDLNAQRTATGWTPLGALPTRTRERLNSEISELTELLAPVASICEPRRTR